MRDPGEIINDVFLLEERKLPDGEWQSCEVADHFETIEGGKEQADEWKAMEYDDDSKFDLRLVRYVRADVVYTTEQDKEGT